MKLKSVLQNDLSKCYVTGSTPVAIHHIFPGTARRRKCERYGFIVALKPELHNMGNESVHANPNKGLDLELKQSAQRYYEAHYGKRMNFIYDFGRSYL